MIHYAEAIGEKGSLDGYNTELSERLHIDFAKAGYRAGNHRDYIAHMTTWLSRQEAVRDQQEFHKWLSEGPITPHEITVTADEETYLGTDASELDIMHADLITPPVPISITINAANSNEDLPIDDNDIRFLSLDNPRLYQIAKKCPLKGVPLAYLEAHHFAQSFLVSLQDYARRNYANSPLQPTSQTTFNIYKQIKVNKPETPFTGNRIPFEKVRAVAPTVSQGRTSTSVGAFDPILVIEDVLRFKAAERQALDGTCNNDMIYTSSPIHYKAYVLRDCE